MIRSTVNPRLPNSEQTFASQRTAFSLFEILLALALLAGAMAAISQLMEIGLQASLRNQLRTEGMFLCERKLAELLVGEDLPTTTSETPFEDAAGWSWSTTTADGPRTDLLRLEVNSVHYTDEDSPREDMRVTLVRLIRIPTVPATETETTALPSSRASAGGAG